MIARKRDTRAKKLHERSYDRYTWRRCFDKNKRDLRNNHRTAICYDKRVENCIFINSELSSSSVAGRRVKTYANFSPLNFSLRIHQRTLKRIHVRSRKTLFVVTYIYKYISVLLL